MRSTLLLVATLAALGALGGNADAAGGPVMPLSQVQPGMDCTGESVVQGTTITSFGVHVVNVVDDPEYGPRILVRVSGPAVDATGIAEGFSGSPVMCPMPDGSLANAGALSAALPEYGNDLGEVTPIQQMLGEPVTPPPAASPLRASGRPLTGPLMIGGLAPGLMHDVQAEAARFGRLVITQPDGPFTNFPVQPLIPGASVAASYSTGAIAMGAVGTVTYRNGQNVYAFGHELDAAGRRDLLLQDAYVYGVLGNPLTGSYKLAAPGHAEGTLSSDTPSAVVGTVGALPPLVPVDATAVDVDTGQTLTLSSQVADETDVGLPLGSSIVDAVAPLEAAQAATEIYDGPPANESGSMCAQIHLRELHSPLSFCNRYVVTGSAGDSSTPALATAVGSDLTSAFGALEQVRFASLHVTGVSMQIRAQRGLAEAAIVRARAPGQARPGQLVTVRLLVRAFRGATSTVSFRLRIPRSARGRFTVRLKGPAPASLTGGPSSNALGGGGLSALLAGAGGAGGQSGPPPPPVNSLAELRSAVAAIAGYDGLTATSAGRPPARVYRNRDFVITGRTTLSFRIR